MLPVSQSWRDAITEHRTKHIRGAMKASVYLGAFDETASGDASFSENVGQMVYSDADNLNSPDSQECSYATWEKDTFRGDGVQYILPSDNAYLRQGWISSEMSLSDGSFSTNPTITIEFGEPHSMIGLTILFDPYFVATDFTIVQYNSGSVIDTDSFSGNTDYLWTHELSISDADKIVIEFTGANPYNRIHVQHILFGIGYTYDSNDLIDLSLVRANNPLSLTLPEVSLTFSLFNQDGRFNVDRDDSLIRFLREDQKVVATMWFDVASVADNISGSLFSYNPDTGELSFSSTEFYNGLEIQSGYLVQVNGNGKMYIKDGFLYGDNSEPVWEQLKLCTLWLKSWDVKGSVATFKCEDAIQRLNNIEYSDSDFGNTALDTRLDDLMTYAGYSNYEFAMANQPCLVFPKLPVAQLLQLSANLTMSTLEQDADAKVIIRPRIEPVISSISAHGTTEPWSVVSSISQSGNATYAILENNFFTGDGSQIFMGTPYVDNGITWDEFPVGGDYSNAIVDIILTDNATFGSLNVTFPQPFVPTAYIVRGYRWESGAYTQVYERTVDGYTSNIIDVFDRIQKLEITIDGCEENQRARLKSVSLGWSTGYDIVSEDIIDRPTGKILTACRNVIADKRNYTAESGVQIASVDCEAGVDIDISYSEPCTGISASADSGTVTIVESHAYHTVVRTSANAKVTLTGTKQIENQTQEVESVNLHGEDLEINNPLISTLPGAYNTWAKAYAERNTEYQFETLGFPELEAADLIDYKGESAQIIKHTLNFKSGACRSQFIVRKE